MFNIKPLYAIIVLITLTAPLCAMDKISPLMEKEARKSVTDLGKDKEGTFWPVLVDFVFRMRDEVVPDIKNYITKLESKKELDGLIDTMSTEITLCKSIVEDLAKGVVGGEKISQLTTRMQKYFTMIRTSEKTYKETDDFIFRKLNLPRLDAAQEIANSLREIADKIWNERFKEYEINPNTSRKIFDAEVVQEIMPDKCVLPVMLQAYFDARDVVIPNLKKQLDEQQKSLSLHLSRGYSNISKLRGKSWPQVLKSMDNPKESLNTLKLMDKYFRDMKQN